MCNLNLSPAALFRVMWRDGNRHVLPAVHANTIHALAYVVESVRGKSHRWRAASLGTPHLELRLAGLRAGQSGGIGNGHKVLADIPPSGRADPKDEVSGFVVPVGLVRWIRTKHHMNTFGNVLGPGVRHDRGFNFYKLAGVAEDSPSWVGLFDAI